MESDFTEDNKKEFQQGGTV